MKKMIIFILLFVQLVMLIPENVVLASIAPPVVSYPINGGAYDKSTIDTFRWDPISGVDYYLIQLYDYNDGCLIGPGGKFIPAIMKNTGNLFVMPQQWLTENHKYLFMVAASDIQGNALSFYTPIDFTINASINVTSVTISPSTLTLNTGTTSQLTATVSPSTATNKTVTWSSSNTSIATVNSNGLVTALSDGNATITVTTVDGGKTATCSVTVAPATVPVTGVTISPSTLTLNTGATSQLTATVTPTTATNKTVTWSSNNTAVVTVNSSTGLVTAVSTGNATITATTEDGGKTATSLITVQVNPNAIPLTVTSTTACPGEYATITVNLGANSGMTAGTFDINFDSNVMTIENSTSDVTLGSILSGMNDYNISTSKVTFTCISTNKINNSGAMITVKFKVKSTAQLGDSNITLIVKEFSTSDASYNSISIPYNVTNGKVTVQNITRNVTEVQSFEVTDSLGNTLSVLTPGQTVSVSAILKNNGTISVNPVIIAALFDVNHKLKMVKILKSTSALGSGKLGAITGSFVLPSSVTGCTLKVMVLEGTMSIKPLASPIVV